MIKLKLLIKAIAEESSYWGQLALMKVIQAMSDKLSVMKVITDRSLLSLPCLLVYYW